MKWTCVMPGFWRCRVDDDLSYELEQTRRGLWVAIRLVHRVHLPDYETMVDRFMTFADARAVCELDARDVTRAA